MENAKKRTSRPYLCIVFFIVLDLGLTRLGYRGIPFFMSKRKFDEANQSLETLLK